MLAQVTRSQTANLKVLGLIPALLSAQRGLLRSDFGSQLKFLTLKLCHSIKSQASVSKIPQCWFASNLSHSPVPMYHGRLWSVFGSC